MHVNSSGMHVNSCGALGHKNSCHAHAAEVRRGTKAPSTNTRLGVRCPAVGTRKFAWRGMGQHTSKPGPEDFPGGGNHSRVCSNSGMS